MVNLKIKKKGTKYKLAAIAICSVLLFFLSSKIIFNAPDEEKFTPLGTPINFNFGSAKMTDHIFFSEDNILEIDFTLEQGTSDMPPKITSIIKEKSNQKKQYNPELIKVKDSFYILFIKGLPKNWETVSIELKDENADQSVQQKKFYVTANKVKNKSVFVKKTKDFYEEKFIQVQLKDTHTLIANETEKQKKLSNDIAIIKAQNQSLKEEIEYQISDEKRQTESKIQSNNSKIDTKEKEVSESKSLSSELQEKIRLLEKRKSELVVN
ncbi:hypothetical protein V7422_17910 [Bacillus safensis]|uniref:hypothetical protein n=1 Tax=Bacillus safensis TaxID=561879 RepID=UPI002FFD8062